MNCLILLQDTLLKYDLEEAVRRDARNNLDSFLSEHMKQPGGVLGNIDPERTKELTDLRNWNNGTKYEYITLLAYWKKEVEQIKKRNDELERVDDSYIPVDVFDYTLQVSMIILRSGYMVKYVICIIYKKQRRIYILI